MKTNKTQVLHRTRLHPFTPKDPIPGVKTTSKDWQHDPEVIMKEYDLHVKLWCLIMTSLFVTKIKMNLTLPLHLEQRIDLDR